MAAQLSTLDVQVALQKLGYYDGEIDGDYQDANFRDDLKRFQRDYGLVGDGSYGPKTDAKLRPLLDALATAPTCVTRSQCRRWLLTYYYVGDATAWRGPTVTMKTPSGTPIAKMPAGAFAEAALEGATKLADGRVAGVAHPAYGRCDSTEFQPVYDIAKRNGWVPEKPGYAGIQLSPDKKSAVSDRRFNIRKTGPKGWPYEAKGIECDPFRTLAADNGLLPRHDPAYRKRGGVVPAGTRVWILEFVGVRLPDGTTHDGWFTVNDTGGGIYGAHFDVFAGTKKLAKLVAIPPRAHIWFEGIETRIPMNYSYGL